MVNTEVEAAKLLLSEGVPIKIGKRTYKIKEMNFGMLDAITALRLSMTLDEDALKTDPIKGANEVLSKNTTAAAKIVAVAILGPGRVKRKLFTGLIAWWIKEKLKPSILLEAAMSIIQMTNVSDFMNSIRLLHGIRMTAPTTPNLVEKMSSPRSGKEEPSAKNSDGPTTT